MQRPFLLFSPPSSPISLFPCQQFCIYRSPVSFQCLSRFPAGSSYSPRPVPAPLCSATAGVPAIAEAVIASTEEEREETDFIEVGYISKVHGLKGELRVKPTTDFPQLRFSTPGRRWLRARISGKEVISEVELAAGRGHPGQKSWIISLRGIDTVDKAKQIVGSTLLVREGDRPELEEGEFYTPDLVGMRVVLKETGRLVGIVVNVFNYGAGDLLQVMLNSTKEKLDHSKSSKPDIGASGPVVWVPFVEAIVPEVDMDRREMHITPPKGLLELNLRKDLRSKKERRQLEWKERKKLQHRLTAAKRKLCEMGQNQLLEGLRVGEKAQKSLLAKQIVGINFKLFQHAKQSINKPFNRFSLSEFIHANSAIFLKNAFKISVECRVSCASEEKNDINYEFYKEGLQLLMKSKAAIVVVVNDVDSVGTDSELNDVCVGRPESKLLQFQELLLDYKRLLKVEEQGRSIPLILVSPAHEMRSYEELLLDNDYFGLDSRKVWFLEEEKLPIVSACSDSNKILLKSSWEILQAPSGSGGVFSLLSSHKILDNLIEMGVEYVQVFTLGERSRSAAFGNPLLIGLVKSHGADMGINMLEGKEEEEDEFDMVFSMSHLNKMCKQINKLHFRPVPEQHAHVELVEEGGEWVEKQVHPIPDTPNSYRLYSSIYSALNNCSLDTICIMYTISG